MMVQGDTCHPLNPLLFGDDANQLNIECSIKMAMFIFFLRE